MCKRKVRLSYLISQVGNTPVKFIQQPQHMRHVLFPRTKQYPCPFGIFTGSSWYHDPGFTNRLFISELSIFNHYRYYKPKQLVFFEIKFLYNDDCRVLSIFGFLDEVNWSRRACRIPCFIYARSCSVLPLSLKFLQAMKGFTTAYESTSEKPISTCTVS